MSEPLFFKLELDFDEERTVSLKVPPDINFIENLHRRIHAKRGMMVPLHVGGVRPFVPSGQLRIKFLRAGELGVMADGYHLVLNRNVIAPLPDNGATGNPLIVKVGPSVKPRKCASG